MATRPHWPLLVCALLLLPACGDDDHQQAAPTPTATATAVPTATATPNPLAQACVASGGTVGSALCCLSASDFPPSCGIGACGCPPAGSHTVARCECPSGSCWNGSTCSAPATPTPTPTPDPLAVACTAAGGTVTRALCCAGAGDFPNACGIGACGCAPSASEEVDRCECPEGTCWDGSTCASAAARACVAAGGTVATRDCCATVADFPATCGPVTSCTECFPPGSPTRAVAFCDCPTSGDCWNGDACVPDLAQ